jgi:hypothetical protein
MGEEERRGVLVVKVNKVRAPTRRRSNNSNSRSLLEVYEALRVRKDLKKEHGT